MFALVDHVPPAADDELIVGLMDEMSIRSCDITVEDEPPPHDGDGGDDPNGSDDSDIYDEH